MKKQDTQLENFNLKRFRQWYGFTQMETIAIMHISKPTYLKYEKMKKLPKKYLDRIKEVAPELEYGRFYGEDRVV